jgi:hypothetical protein
MENAAAPTQQSVNITLSILETKCLSFGFTEYGAQNKDPIPFNGYEFVFTINFTVFDVEKQARVTIHVKFNEKKTEHLKLELAQLSASCLFSIVNFNELVKKDVSNNNFIIQNPAIELCSSITISAIRGMFAVKLDNSLYANAVLPLLDVRSLFTQGTIIKPNAVQPH